MFEWYNVKDCKKELRYLEKKWLGVTKVTILGYRQFEKDRYDLGTPPEIHKATLRIKYRELVDEMYDLKTRMKQLGCYLEHQDTWSRIRDQMRDAKDLLMIHYDIIKRIM